MNKSSDVPTVEIGSLVKVKEHGLDEEEVFRLGNVTRPLDNQVAPDDAMGKALLGAHPGDEVTVEGPAGPIKFDVLDVRQDQSD